MLQAQFLVTGSIFALLLEESSCLCRSLFIIRERRMCILKTICNNKNDLDIWNSPGFWCFVTVCTVSYKPRVSFIFIFIVLKMWNRLQTVCRPLIQFILTACWKFINVQILYIFTHLFFLMLKFCTLFK